MAESNSIPDLDIFTSRSENLKPVKEEAFLKLKQLETSLRTARNNPDIKEKDEKSKDPLERATKNIDFVENDVVPILHDYLSITGGSIHLLGSRKPQEEGDDFAGDNPLRIHRSGLYTDYWTGRLNKGEAFTPDLCRELLAGSDQMKYAAVKFSRMSKVEIVKRVQSEMKTRDNGFLNAIRRF